MSPTPQLIAALQEDVRFFSNSGKEERERWVFEHWCAITGRNPANAKKPDPPDFQLGSESIEVVEVLHLKRKRHDEFKQTVNRATESPSVCVVHEGASMEEIISEAHKWVIRAVDKKRQHYKHTAQGWILLVYLNYEFAGHTHFHSIRSALAALNLQFKAVEDLLPDGQSCHQLFP